MRQRIVALEQEKEAFERRASAELARGVESLRQQLLGQAQRRSDAAARQAARPLADSERLLAQTLSEMRRSLGLESAKPGDRSPRRFAVGDQVYVHSFDASGVVSEVYDDNLLVTMGNLKTLIPATDVSPKGGASQMHQADADRVDRGPSQGQPKKSKTTRVSPHVADRPAAHDASTSVDVRGMRVDEAWPLVDKALDNATLAGLSELRVIHGRGTGQLGRGIREFLEDHAQVESLSSPPDREGGAGVTIVKLV